MLLLTSTSDLIRVVTTAAADTDVHASYVDLNGSTVTPGRTNTIITTATTTTVVPSPTSSSTLRTVKTLTVRNRHASLSQTVTITHTDGTTAVQLFSTVLAAGESLYFHEAAGFWTTDAFGRNKTAEFANAGAATGSGLTTVVLGSDVTNNNGTANTMQDVTGLSFAVTANNTFYFQFNILFTAAATTTGSRWSINGPASPTYLNYESRYSLTTTTETRNALLQAYDQPSAANGTSATTGNNWARIEGVIRPTANGTVIARFASEVASSAIVAKVGSFVLYQQIA